MGQKTPTTKQTANLAQDKRLKEQSTYSGSAHMQSKYETSTQDHGESKRTKKRPQVVQAEQLITTLQNEYET